MGSHPLSELKSEEEFLQETRAQGVNALDTDSLTSVWSTLSLLAQSSRHPEQLSFVFPSVCIATSASANSVPKSQGEFTRELTYLAHTTSAAAACSSLLVGRSSESDEYGDVGLLLPLIEGDNREGRVIELLGLESWQEEEVKIITLDGTQNLPGGVSSMVKGAGLDHLTSLFSRLEEPFEFYLQGKTSNVIWVYLGKVSVGGQPHLAGLIGAGTWTE